MLFPERPGLTDPSVLTAYTGPNTVTGNVTASNCIVTHQIRVNAGASLSLTNCWVKVNVFDPGYGMIGKAGRIDLNHVLVDGTGFNDVTFPIIFEGGGSSWFSEYVGNTDNARIDSPVDFEWNYIHGGKAHTATGGSHSDGLEIYYGGGDLIANNYIDIGGAEGANSCVNITNDFGPVTDVTEDANTCLPGGNYSVYYRGDGYCSCGGNLSNIVVTNNRFFASAADRWAGYYGVFSYKPEVGIATWSGNTLTRTTGAVVLVLLSETQP